nr:hypothetical protein Q903MT_gene2554 [Picea sitchensis]
MSDPMSLTRYPSFPPFYREEHLTMSLAPLHCGRSYHRKGSIEPTSGRLQHRVVRVLFNYVTTSRIELTCHLLLTERTNSRVNPTKNTTCSYCGKSRGCSIQFSLLNQG